MLLILLLSNLAILLFCYKRTLRYLHALQQDEYSISRFYQWFIANKAFDKRGALIALPAIILTGISPWYWLDVLLSIIGSSTFLFAFLWEYDPRKTGKLLLIMTPRAKRILSLALALFTTYLAIIAATLLLKNDTSFSQLWLWHLITIQLTPLFVIIAIKALQPHEQYLTKNFLQDARKKILKADPKTIAITGSFGKSSVKNALGEILQVTVGSTFWPSGGVNTLMGTTRCIRDGLNPYYDNMIIEMAAYRKGSIASLCELTPPSAAIITAIGAMHLERFGSLENIYQAKTELARALPQEGILVCNGDDVGARKAAKEFATNHTYLYGFDNEKQDLACYISDLNFSEQGSHFTLHWQGQTYPGFSQLLGRPAMANLMAVFTMAAALGADPDFVIASIANLKPLNNRLSIEKSQDQLFLMDAYNSNPIGFQSALEVLETLAKNRTSRQVLITPGMIELGELQDQANQDIAEAAAKTCDLILFVGDTNLAAFQRGLEKSGFPKSQFHTFAHRNDALASLDSITESNDTILIENDLPDLYEGTPSF